MDRLEKLWMESNAQIDKLGNLYYVTVEGERIGKCFRTLTEAKMFCRNRGVEKARYFVGGGFKRIVVC